MTRVAYVNGQYLPFQQAGVHVEDRGYQFADGVYEVVAVFRHRLIDEIPHLDRLDRSLRELRITPPMSRPALQVVLREMVRRNGLASGILYLQITRGVARRDHAFPHAIDSSLVVTFRRISPPSPQVLAEGVAVVSLPDIRWGRCDIKSISLLPNILAKQQAKEAGAYEAWLVDRNGFVTEGSSTNAWIVTRDGELVTRDAGPAILGGITRNTLIGLAKAVGLRLTERPFDIKEAQAAAEAFLSSTTSYVLPVTRIDGQPVGDGRPGPLTLQLRAAYQQAVIEGHHP